MMVAMDARFSPACPMQQTDKQAGGGQRDPAVRFRASLPHKAAAECMLMPSCVMSKYTGLLLCPDDNAVIPCHAQARRRTHQHCQCRGCTIRARAPTERRAEVGAKVPVTPQRIPMDSLGLTRPALPWYGHRPFGNIPASAKIVFQRALVQRLSFDCSVGQINERDTVLIPKQGAVHCATSGLGMRGTGCQRASLETRWNCSGSTTLSTRSMQACSHSPWQGVYKQALVIIGCAFQNPDRWERG